MSPDDQDPRPAPRHAPRHDPRQDYQQDAAALADELRPAILRLNRRLRQETQLPGVSPTLVTVLAAIRRKPGIGVGELALLERMRAPTMSAHVKHLERAGLIGRSAPSQADRRRVGLSITKEGERVLDTIRRQRTDWLAGRLARLAPSARAAIHDAVAALGELSQ